MSFIAEILTRLCSIMSWWWPRVYKAFKNLAGNYYQETSVPLPIHQPCLKEWRWTTIPKPHVKTTLHSSYKLGCFGNWELQHFSEIMFLEKHSISLFWKPADQKSSFLTQTLLMKAKTGASWESKWEGQPWISSLNAVEFKLCIKCHWSIKLCEDVTHTNMFHSIWASILHRHTHFGRFTLWLEKSRRCLFSYRAKPENPAILLKEYQRIWQHATPT